MDIWKCLEILKQPNKTWFHSKSNTDEKLDALNKIACEGCSTQICNLFDFLKDNNKEIRYATCQVIVHLFKKIDSKKGYYDTLKHCDISKIDIDFYKSNFPHELYVELLAICSLNSSGYIREEAVKKLATIDNPRAIQFLIYRLADWVLPVRKAALNGIENYKKQKFIDGLIVNLPIFDWLQKVERTNLNGVYQDIIEYIAIVNKVFVIENFKKYPDKLRLILARHFSWSIKDNSEELRLLLSDKHFLIRNMAIEHFDKLKHCEIDQLLDDRSARVRLQTLYCLKERANFETLIKGYLADNSATIRHFARFTLKNTDVDFINYYYQNLLQDNQVIGSLTGLVEVGAKQYSEIVKKYLEDKKIKVRKTAFLVLCKLESESAYDYALLNLDTSHIGLRNLIIEFLSHIPRREVLESAREIFKKDSYDLKKSMLSLFNKIGGWSSISDLILGTIDENENIRQLALAYVQIWKDRAVRLFTTPRQDEIERATQILIFAKEIHENKKYFKTNPLIGLDFYFK